jgi:outer membrane receptor protein involved in Fe transport
MEPGSITPPGAATVSDTALEAVVVTAARLGLIGMAVTSGQGVIVNDELALTPAYRPGQLLETVPGLVVTSHSGEGKANQYLLRGFNLDHGTDLATFVDGMPINQVTHAHGQGYTDLNFMIAELATDIQFTKGPYFADEGDFASVGSVHVNYLNTIPDQIALTAGTLGFQRLFAAGSTAFGDGNLLAALELQHYDGPWVNPDDQRKINADLRYSGGDRQQGYSLTGMFYHGLWNATTDQPVRATADGLISRFGSLDPSDGGLAQRWSLSGEYHDRDADGEFAANGYVIGNQLTLWNNFKHFLTDPVNGDQEAQHEGRSVAGGGMSYRRRANWLSFDGEWIAGLQLRSDLIDVSRSPTKDRQPLAPSADPLGFAENDHVRESSMATYAQITTHWSSWLRSVLGLREDYFHERDSGTNPGSVGQALLQPKGSLIFTPVDTTELYVSAGRGFHSDDARGVNQAALTGQSGAPLIAKSTGEEIGVRRQFGQRIAATLTMFNIDFQSETTYDPDAGVDTAGPPSRRYGAELNVTYQALRWLEFYATLATSHARYTQNYDDGTGHSGTYIPNAPNVIASLATYVKNRGPWSGGLDYRYLGSEPLTPDNAVRGGGYGEWNGDVRYSTAGGWNLVLGLYNILNQHSNAAEFWYVDRLPGEAAQGVADVHTHPLEPFTVRVTIGKTF